MVFVTPSNAARYIGTYAQILTPYHQQELHDAGLFLCKLVENEIESTKSARESDFAKKMFPEEFPLPPAPGNFLAAEYFFGSRLSSLMSEDAASRTSHWETAARMEQQLSKQIIQKPTLSEICLAALRSANIQYLTAASHFLYPMLSNREERGAAITFSNKQAKIRYKRLDSLFNILSVPEITARHLDFIQEMREAKKGQTKRDIRRKINELKQREPELYADLIQAERAQYQASFTITYGLRGFIPMDRRTYWKVALPSMKAHQNHLEKEIFTDYLVHKNQIIPYQEVLLGLMRCYALDGNYRKIMKIGQRLHSAASDHKITMALTAAAHHIELRAQEHKLYFGTCRRFVPRAPESVARMIASFMSSYESSGNRLFLNTGLYGCPEIGRQVEFKTLRAA